MFQTEVREPSDTAKLIKLDRTKKKFSFEKRHSFKIQDEAKHSSALLEETSQKNIFI